MKRFLNCILAASACTVLLGLASCGKGEGELPVPEQGRYYMVEAGGQDLIMRVDNIDDGEFDGIYYDIDDAPVADAHRYSLKYNARKVILDADGKTFKMKPAKVSVTPYEAPEYIEADTRLYRERFCRVNVSNDVTYGHARGYWTSLPQSEDEMFKKVAGNYLKSFNDRELDLTLDLYQPAGLEGKKPLILFIHGGAFYIGDKQEPAYIDFCRHFASMGYVTASMNYRMGFHANKEAIDRAGYMAIQDAHAAMRFLVANAEKYGIDTDQLYVAGSSAGSITAMNMVFMNEKSRPQASFGTDKKKSDDLGPINSSGNDLKVNFHVRALANLWGAIPDLDMLANSKTDIISFHGDADRVVPYDEGFPFSNEEGGGIGTKFFGKMYGSVSIDKAARKRGLRSEFRSFPGEGHAFNVNKDKSVNSNHYVIRDSIQHFFFTEMVPVQAAITEGKPGVFTVGKAESSDVQWKADGGFILEASDGKVKVLWQADAPKHVLHASGHYADSPIGFVTTWHD